MSLLWKYVRNYALYAVIAALFMICEVLTDLLQPDLMRYIIDDGIFGIRTGIPGNTDLIIRSGLLMIGLTAFGGFCGTMNNVFACIASQRAGNDMRKDCFRRIFSFSPSQIDGYTTGALITRVTNDITQIQNFIALFIRGIIRTIMLTVGSIWFMFRLSPGFGMIVLASMPFILGCIFICLYKAAPLFPKVQACLDDINGIMQEDISGIRVIKACSRETYEKIRFGKANDNLIRTQLKTVAILFFMVPSIHMIIYFIIALILFYGSSGAVSGASSGEMTAGAVMAAIAYTTLLFHGILMLVMVIQTMSRGTASWKRVREILETEPEMKDDPLPASGMHRETPAKGSMIEFRHVSFIYPESSRPVLDNVSFTIRPGETVAFMGVTGCGKTTLVSLIPRFMDVTGGQILVDNIDVRDYPQQELRRKIAVALQKTELFTESVAGNIRFGNPDSGSPSPCGSSSPDGSSSSGRSPSPDGSSSSGGSPSSGGSVVSGFRDPGRDVREAAEIAQAAEFIERLPDGYDTILAERGMNLSGGQRQRLSLARTIFRNADIMIFDDATSALDLMTEASFYEALNRSGPACTKIIVAQRIASVRRADRIFILDGGKIIAAGTHDELLKTCGVYRGIYDSQIETQPDPDDSVSPTSGAGRSPGNIRGVSDG